MLQHDLKVLPEFFEAAAYMLKPFEVRKHDRPYSVGDLVVLHEWNGESYTGRVTAARKITYILASSSFSGVSPGYVVLGLQIF